MVPAVSSHTNPASGWAGHSNAKNTLVSGSAGA